MDSIITGLEYVTHGYAAGAICGMISVGIVYLAQVIATIPISTAATAGAIIGVVGMTSIKLEGKKIF